MTTLIWDKVGERRFETGIDHGVLYIDGAGFAWSGLVAVKEGHSGGESRAYYVDGIRYANRITLEEFEATIEAYTYPEQFGVCDGTKSLGNGLFVTQQRRKQFGFSYRTKVGNDVEGLDHGYKLHIVYNALAQPVDRAYETLSDSTKPFLFSWKVVTKPPVLDFVPTAHFIIDSRTTPDGLLSQIEDILYGTPEQMPRLPSATELAFLFTSYEVTDYDAGDPDDVVYYTFDGGAPIQGAVTTILDGGYFQLSRTNVVNQSSFEGPITDWISSWGTILSTDTAEKHSGMQSLKLVTPGDRAEQGSYLAVTLTDDIAVGDVLTASAWVKAPLGAALDFYFWNNVPDGSGRVYFTGTGDWQRISAQGLVAPDRQPYLSVYTQIPQGAVTFWLDDVLIEKSATALPYFDGSTTDEAEIWYYWSGAANNSKSIALRLEPTEGGSP